MHSAAADSDEEKVFVKRKKRSSIFFKKKPVSYTIIKGDFQQKRVKTSIQLQITTSFDSIVVCCYQ